MIYSQYLWNIKTHNICCACSASRMQSSPTENTILDGFPIEKKHWLNLFKNT